MIAVSFLSPRQVRRSALIVFAISIVLIVATLLFGPEVKGAKRWITILGVNMQASEIAKPAFVCWWRGCSRNPRGARKCRRPRWRWRCC